MKKLTSLLLCICFPLLCGASAALADDDGEVRGQVHIEGSTPGGANVVIVEGTVPGSGEGFVEATRVTTNTVRVPVKTVTKVVEVPVANAPHKARLAVLPAIFSRHFKPEIRFADKLEVAGMATLKAIFTTEHETRWEAPSFTVSLTEAFVGSRKFDVLERARLTEVLREVDFGESGYADVSRVVPMGQALNAEYVVLPEIEVINLVFDVQDVPYVDQVQPKLRGKMIARLRIADTAETRLVAAFTETVEVERRVKPEEPFPATEWNSLILDLYGAAGQRMMLRALEAIYPPKILEIAGGKVVLNRGEGAIGANDEFEVYELGKVYTDPDTGEVLGQGESRVARIRIIRTTPKFSEAEIVEGADRLVGDPRAYLCRETNASIARKTKVPRTPLAW
jgi:hypothetical protein